ncbi:hypothetical protein IMSAGC011_03125 [Lachnospiraceae bacterium]|nr:hypothetical protein IMSAGC011_03125 [Lachnospiraceae bacterium]
MIDDCYKPKKILENVKTVSLGGFHSGAITEDGSLYMWGYNNRGQIGDGTITNHYVPIKITIPDDATGKSHALSGRSSYDIAGISDTWTNRIMKFSAIFSSEAVSGNASFTDLTPGETYNIYEIKDSETENILSASNLLYIGQSDADSDGSISITYEPRETCDSSVIFAVANIPVSIRGASISVSDVYADGTVKMPDLFVYYNGYELEEGIDYELSGQYSAAETGDYTLTVEGIGIFRDKMEVVWHISEDSGRKLEMPTSSIASGSTVESGTRIKLISNENAQIYYTLDETTPTVSSTLFTEDILITQNTIIKAFAVQEGLQDSDVATFIYNVSATGNPDELGDVLPEDIPESGIPDGLWIAGIKDMEYTGKAIKPSVRVYDYKTKLTEKQDYTISYKNNINVNDTTNENKAPSVVIQAKGNYSGKETATFQILAKDINSIDFDIADITVNPNKKVQKPVPAVIFKGKRLSSKKDFAVTYPDTFAGAYKEKGTYSIKISGKGNYTGERTINFTITDSNLITKAKTSKISSQQYTGKALTPTIQVKYGKTTLKEGKDYELSYRDNTKIGTATVIIKGKGDYSGQKAVSFKIIGASISKGTVVGLNTPSTFNGSEITKNFYLVIIVNGNQRTLKEGQDYTVKYQNNKKAGNATLVLTGINGYSGTLKKTFKINAYNLQTDTNKKIRYSNDLSVAYAKNGSCPDPVIYFDGTKLEKGKDYSLSYKNNKAVNTGGNSATAPMIIVKGKGNFTGTLPITFSITSQNLSNLILTANDKAYKNRANIFATSIKITDINGKALSAGKDYDKNRIVYTFVDAVKLENGVTKKAGDNVEKTDIIPADTKIQVSVIAKAGGNYEGTATGVYRIIKSDIKNAKISIPAQTYTGKAIIPTKSDITVTVGGTKLAESEFEIVSCTNNIKKGKASITIKGRGNYGGTKTIKFTIKSKGFLWWWRR